MYQYQPAAIQAQAAALLSNEIPPRYSFPPKSCSDSEYEVLAYLPCCTLRRDNPKASIRLSQTGTSTLPPRANKSPRTNRKKKKKHAMSSRTLPPALEPYLQLPPETSLILLTSTLGCSVNWLTARFISSALASDHRQQQQEPSPPPLAILLVSWIRDLAFWKTELRRTSVSTTRPNQVTKVLPYKKEKRKKKPPKKRKRKAKI